MNTQQTIAAYKSAKNTKILLENEVKRICSVQQLIDIDERALATMRYKQEYNCSIVEAKQAIDRMIATHTKYEDVHPKALIPA